MEQDLTKSRDSLIRRAGWLSIIGNILLFALKLWAGIVSSSVAIMADAWHTLTDSLTSVIVIVSNIITRKPADRKHPFGHGRAEPIAAAFIGVLLALVAFDFVIEGIRALRANKAASFGTIAVVVTIVSILIKEGMAQYSFWIAKKANSAVVKADGWHHRSDALSSLVILAGIFLSGYFWWIDAVLGFIVAGLIAYTAFGVLKSTISNLLGEKADPEMIENVTRITQEMTKWDVDPHHFHAHSYGDHTELTFHICLPGDMKINDSHDIVDAIENRIHAELDIHATIHIDPL